MLGRGSGESDQPDHIEQWGLFDVTTNAAALNTSTNAQVMIDAFNDLGTGSSYGSFDVDVETTGNPARLSEVLSFPLNAAALSDINASAGGYFSIGGKWLSISAGNDNSFASGVQWTCAAKSNSNP
jgi:hypothetical protein